MRRVSMATALIWVALLSAGGCSHRSTPAPVTSTGVSEAHTSTGISAVTTASGEARRSDRVIQVVATTSVTADWLRVIGGTNVRTSIIVKAGLDPVSYLATSVDVSAVRQADLIVAVGRGLEPWLEPARQAAGTTKPVVTLTDRLAQRVTASGAADPYLWLDLANAKQMVSALTAALVSADPADKAAFTRASEGYLADLDRADAEVRRLLGPVAGRGLVTAKETFGWFAAGYGLETVGSVVSSLDGRAEIDAQHLATLADALRVKQVKAVFAEASVPDDNVRALAATTGVKPVVGAEALVGDGLGPAGTEAGTFLGAIRHNALSIAKNLA